MAGAGRYAPSPSGDLHVGNLRTAVVAWLMARTSGRRFLLRVEDLDPDRSSPEAAVRQRADLAAVGLDFDPPTLVQSDRDQAYVAAIDGLGDLVYECFCTRREIAEAARAPHATAGLYPGTCTDLTGAERIRRRRERPAALRVRAERATRTVIDRWHGEVSGMVDDVVVRRNDGVAAYQLAVVVDDAATGVDQVVRGDDLLWSAPSQAWLADRLGVPAPTYGHVPLALAADGRRLAKRDGAITLADLAPLGLGPDRVRSLIAASLGLAEPGEPVTMTDLLDRFDPDRLPRHPWVVDPAGLV